MTKKELQAINKEYEYAVYMWDYCYDKEDEEGRKLYSRKRLHYEQLMEVIGYKLDEEKNEFYKA